ncbi:methyltransferase family protein [Saccharopolyspora griseoalba]|uniref:Methyltransferase family protein n=1 Tax=Saccharopolyspora griseoalba TaxID=1431848 RepID=A0ABW2LKM1_9PSEU
MIKDVVRSLVGFVVLGALVFLPAWTFDYWQAWVFLAVFALSAAIPSFHLARADPAALERRKRAGRESRPAQRIAVAVLFSCFPVMLVLSVLDHRFGWSAVPAAVALLGDVLVAAGMVLTVLVVLQNRFAAGNIAVEPGQQVVSTGMYGVVRHPMYSTALLAVVGSPLALGSLWGLVFLVPVVVALVVRIRDEEALLAQELDGYREYARTTRYRLVPGIW